MQNPNQGIEFNKPGSYTPPTIRND